MAGAPVSLRMVENPRHIVILEIKTQQALPTGIFK
jgi:hypothetical protein